MHRFDLYDARMTRIRLLYLQLPLLDNDADALRENFPFAGAYLDHALQRSTEAPYHCSTFAPTKWDRLDTHHLVKKVLSSGTDIVVCTLYLWNIERALRLAALLKKEDPTIRIVAGGPEAAKDHPLLAEALFDAVVTGEGEAVFPALLNAWRTGATVEFDNLAQRGPDGWTWGTTPPPVVQLADAQPNEETIMRCVQNRPVVYLETVRGCPLTCSYCRYYQLHTGLRKLTTEQVITRITRFRELGAREIRFVDPTFNARPRFTQLLEALAQLNHDHHLCFFAEIRSDTLKEEQANLMGKANFSAVEVGVQSIDPKVLRNVSRPVRLKKTAEGINALCNAGVQVVLDIMYGLPGQTLTDVHNSLGWALAFGDNVQVQCMQTLILPGTQLRRDAAQWNIEYEKLPPYDVIRTAQLSPDDIREIEIQLHEHPNLPADPVTPRFCGQRLRGLFREQQHVNMKAIEQPVPGQCNRRALFMHGSDLFNHRKAICDLINRAITNEPDTLFQFILVPEHEEPLDLLEVLAECIRNHPAHLLDRFASAAAFNHTVSRRLYVRTNKTISRSWIQAAEQLLRSFFG